MCRRNYKVYLQRCGITNFSTFSLRPWLLSILSVKPCPFSLHMVHPNLNKSYTPSPSIESSTIVKFEALYNFLMKIFKSKVDWKSNACRSIPDIINPLKKHYLNCEETWFTTCVNLKSFYLGPFVSKISASTCFPLVTRKWMW